MMLKWERVDKIKGITKSHIPVDMKPGCYKVVSIGTSILIDRPIVFAYIIRHRGRYIRCKLH